MKAGGFSGVYNGVLATALGAAPGAAMFFSAYEAKPLQALNGGKEHPPSTRSPPAAARSLPASCVRKPTAVVTQLMQVGSAQSYLVRPRVRLCSLGKG